MFRPYKIRKTSPEALGDVMRLFVVKNGLSTGVNIQIIFETWDKVSGAGRYTLNRFYKEGNLFVTISSSVVRSQLSFQKDVLLQMMNDELRSNPLYNKNKGLVSNIILR